LISGRLPQNLKQGVGKVLGPGRPSLKLAALAAVLALAVFALWPGEFRISAKAVLEGSVQRAAVAPFDGFISQAPFRAGDIVQAGQELAILDDRDLLLEKLKWETERQKLVQKQREALAKHDRTNLLVLEAQIDQAQSQLDLALEKLKRTRITSAIDGVIVSGDLSQMLGGPVSQGKVLFEIAPLASYRLILQVDERDIAYLSSGKPGVLLLTGAASKTIDLEITKMTAVATAEDGRNYFRVEASISESGQLLRPGMEGVAKVGVGTRSVLWIWARPLIERARMFVWTWTP
jgi:multidrug efflux pump subunit AcrA (membrane-fusion protein)